MMARDTSCRRGDAPLGPLPIVRPGRNCWRVEPAERAAVLVDGRAFFGAFAEAASRARHSIMIVGWDFNSCVRLQREGRMRRDADEVGAFLRRLLKPRRSLNVYVLEWDFSVIYSLQREILPRYRWARHTHPRFHFHLDDHHPLGGAQHQKIVVIDDAIAFVGGLDFASSRWDTPAHEPDDARRIDPWGNPYPPYHDVEMAVDGAAAAALGELVRTRWLRATGEQLPKAPRGLDAWPAALRPDFQGVDVAIARTMPRYDGEPEAREVEALFADSIGAARRWLYIENQYLTSAAAGDALLARLQERDGPEIVILQPRQCEGWLEETTMGVLRARLMRRLQDADRYGRLRVYHPDVAGLGDRRLTVHAKVLIADDCLLRVGSANLNNRSMGLDSECDLAIDAGADLHCQAGIAAVRDRLLGEHLGQAPSKVANVLAVTGSLIRTIETLNGPARGLRPLDTTVPDWLDKLVPEAAIVDPERPVDADALLALLAPELVNTRPPRAWLRGAVIAAVAVGSALLAWYFLCGS
jgi:phospholipase D1/2